VEINNAVELSDGEIERDEAVSIGEEDNDVSVYKA